MRAAESRRDARRGGGCYSPTRHTARLRGEVARGVHQVGPPRTGQTRGKRGKRRGSRSVDWPARDKGGGQPPRLREGFSATRFVPDTQWAGLKRHEQAFLAAYATGLAAHKAVLVGRSAARVHDMWVLPARDEVVELAQRGGAPPSTSQWPESVTYRRMAVPDANLDTFRGVRLTTRARTAADVARLHGARQGAVAIDGLLYGLATYQ